MSKVTFFYNVWKKGRLPTSFKELIPFLIHKITKEEEIHTGVIYDSDDTFYYAAEAKHKFKQSVFRKSWFDKMVNKDLIRTVTFDTHHSKEKLRKDMAFLVGKEYGYFDVVVKFTLFYLSRQMFFKESFDEVTCGEAMAYLSDKWKITNLGNHKDDYDYISPGYHYLMLNLINKQNNK